MPKYVIEREIPDAGSLSQEQIQAISQKSCGVLKNLGRRFSGSRALSPRTRFIAFTLLPMKRWCGNMPSRATFRRTGFRK
jgi:hypothetical protein